MTNLLPWDLVSAMGCVILAPIVLFVVVFEKNIIEGIIARRRQGVRRFHSMKGILHPADIPTYSKEDHRTLDGTASGGAKEPVYPRCTHYPPRGRALDVLRRGWLSAMAVSP